MSEDIYTQRVKSLSKIDYPQPEVANEIHKCRIFIESEIG